MVYDFQRKNDLFVNLDPDSLSMILDIILVELGFKLSRILRNTFIITENERKIMHA